MYISEKFGYFTKDNITFAQTKIKYKASVPKHIPFRSRNNRPIPLR